MENLVFTSLRHTARLYRIAMTLARHDALFGLEAVSPTTAFVARFFAGREHKHLRRGERLAKAFEALGPTFIKLGQALSVRPDLVGEAISDDLAQLRDNVPPFAAKKARAIIEEELERPIDEVFSQFDEQPIAAASIAQVHFATLKGGEDVAVKVLRPNIQEAFAKDINLLLWLAAIAERRRPQLRRLKPVAMIETFARTIRFELDLRYEAAAASELKDNMQGEPHFYVPEVHWTACAQRVLVTERIKGISMNDKASLAAANIDYTRLIETAAGSFFKQVFRDGFFHADMHPGNMFVLPDGTLAVVDFGIMGRISRAEQLFIAEILWTLLNEDYERAAKIHVNAGFVPASTNIKEFALAIRAITKPILGKPMNEISVGRLLGQLFQVTEDFQMEIQPQLLMLQKSMMLVEGVGILLRPDLNTWKLIDPLINDWAKDNLSPRAQMKDQAKDMAETLRRLPALLKRSEQALKDVQSGGIKLHPETVNAIASAQETLNRKPRPWGWLVAAGLGAWLLLSYV